MNNEYVLVTPARNEEAFIEKTLQSVVQQTVLPKRWVIVSDGSTDSTEDIVRNYVREHKFITLLCQPKAATGRNFGSKVKAFQAGYEQLAAVPYDYIANLDADVSFPPEYFEMLLACFARNPRLGLAGGLVHELINDEFAPQWIAGNSVAGAVQMFRRSCYEEVGGYIAVRFGGIDTRAEIMARVHGWDVQTFPEFEVRHHRRISSGEGPLVSTRLRHGMRHYSLGYHPIFEILRNLYRLGQKPYIVGSVLTTIGYLWAVITRREREIPEHAVRYLHAEQMSRLRAISVRSTRSRASVLPKLSA